MEHKRVIEFPELTILISFESLPEHKLQPAPEFIYRRTFVPKKLTYKHKIERMKQKYDRLIGQQFVKDVFEFTTHNLRYRECTGEISYSWKGEKIIEMRETIKVITFSHKEMSDLLKAEIKEFEKGLELGKAGNNRNDKLNFN